MLFCAGIWKGLTRHPVWALGTYLLVLYLSPWHNWWGRDIPDLRWSLWASLFAFTSVFFNRKALRPKMPWTSNGAAKILIAYTVWLWVQSLWALSFSIHLQLCILYTKYLVLFYIIYTVLDSDRSFFYFICFNILGGLYWAKTVLKFSGQGRVEGVGGAGIDEANVLGMHLSVVLIFTAMMLLKQNTIFNRKSYWLGLQAIFLLSAAYISNGIVQTISRSASLGIIAGGMVILWLKPRKVKKRFYVYLFLAMMGLIVLTPDTFWNRLNTVKIIAQGGEIENSAYSRILQAKAQIEMFKEHIFGAGHRGTAILSPYYLPREALSHGGAYGMDRARSSHITLMTVLVEQGIPGIILYFLMIFWVIKTVHSFPKEDKIAYLYVMAVTGGLSVILISGLFVDYIKVEIQIYCFAMLASLKEYSRMKIISNNENNINQGP